MGTPQAHHALDFVLRSRLRSQLLLLLVNSPSTPSQLAKETNVSVSHVSRALRQLRDMGLVRVIEATSRRRYYGPTPTAHLIYAALMEARRLR